MLKKLKNSFWFGFMVGFIITAVYTYIVWPRIPAPPIGEVKVVLPKIGDTAGIYYPKDGDKLDKVFFVYGAGQAFENQGLLVLTDQKDQDITEVPVYFQTDDPSKTGPFMVTMGLFDLDPKLDAGKLKLFSISPKDGSRQQIGDFVNVRLN